MKYVSISNISINYKRKLPHSLLQNIILIDYKAITLNASPKNDGKNRG